MPRHAWSESADDLAARWLTEWREGIAGTRVRPGFVKLGTGNGPLPALHEKLVRASARVHLESGLTVAIHTGDGAAARDEVRILGEEGVSPEALIWVHAQNDAGPIQIELARRGAWISLDGYSLAPGNPDRYLGQILALRAEGLWDRLLVSHDDGWAVEGEGHGAALRLFGNGNPHPYRSILTHLLPALRRAGVARDEIDALMRTNPARAFAIRIRRSTGA
jgi:phosphotriesterase-related protein